MGGVTASRGREMAAFGVTPEGFVRKGFETILAESLARARAVFGDDVDLSPSSPLCKILEVTAAEEDLLFSLPKELRATLKEAGDVSRALGGRRPRD